jgi:ribonuclease T1
MNTDFHGGRIRVHPWKSVVAFFAAVALLWCAVAWAADLPDISASELPQEARATLALIKQGGPFAYRKDGSVFGNFEQRLPIRSRGYYREYTVPTPGAKDRGARRIVAGSGAAGDVRTSGEYYYTDDHYRSFRRIREPDTLR